MKYEGTDHSGITTKSKKNNGAIKNFHEFLDFKINVVTFSSALYFQISHL